MAEALPTSSNRLSYPAALAFLCASATSGGCGVLDSEQSDGVRGTPTRSATPQGDFVDCGPPGSKRRYQFNLVGQPVRSGSELNYDYRVTNWVSDGGWSKFESTDTVSGLRIALPGNARTQGEVQAEVSTFAEVPTDARAKPRLTRALELTSWPAWTEADRMQLCPLLPIRFYATADGAQYVAVPVDPPGNGRERTSDLDIWAKATQVEVWPAEGPAMANGGQLLSGLYCQWKGITDSELDPLVKDALDLREEHSPFAVWPFVCATEETTLVQGAVWPQTKGRRREIWAWVSNDGDNGGEEEWENGGEEAKVFELEWLQRRDVPLDHGLDDLPQLCASVHAVEQSE